MTIALDIKLTKLLIPLANVRGSFKVDVIAENSTRSFVQGLLLDGLREKGFTGAVIIDGERIAMGPPGRRMITCRPKVLASRCPPACGWAVSPRWDPRIRGGLAGTGRR